MNWWGYPFLLVALFFPGVVSGNAGPPMLVADHPASGLFQPREALLVTREVLDLNLGKGVARVEATYYLLSEISADLRFDFLVVSGADMAVSVNGTPVDVMEPFPVSGHAERKGALHRFVAETWPELRVHDQIVAQLKQALGGGAATG